MGCSCSDCDLSCALPDFSNDPEVEDDFVIVEGVDGVVFIMVILFVVGSIIFLATIFGSSILQRSVVMRKFYLLKSTAVLTLGFGIECWDLSGTPNDLLQSVMNLTFCRF